MDKRNRRRHGNTHARHGQERRRRRQSVWRLLPAAAGLSLLLLAVVAVKAVLGEGKEVAAQPGNEAVFAASEDYGKPGETHMTETSGETGEEETVSADRLKVAETKAAAPPSAVAAEVGSMEDKEDPQTSGNTAGGGSGAAVSISTATLPAVPGETGTVNLGIDVSKYQGTVDWTKVKAAGIEFAMVRVGYRTKVTGIIYEDPAARYNLQEAQKAGIKLGAYFYSAAVTKEEAEEEAAWTAGFLAKYPITYPVAYNCEDFQSSDSRQYGLDKEQRSSIADAFLNKLLLSGYTPMFYASRNEMQNNAQWNMDTLSAKYKVWVSQYPERPFPETPASSYSGSHAMWQYTSQGSVAGIRGKVDVNVAYFGYDQIAQALDTTPPEAVAADPEIGITFTQVDESVTAKIEANLRTAPTTGEGSEITGKLINGQTAARTGIGNNGWSRLEYNGQKVYAVSSYLTTDTSYQQPAPDVEPVQAQPAYEPVNETVTAKSLTNLRTQPNTSQQSSIAATIQNGQTVTRVGIGSNGWSQVDYNGQILYAVSSYLTADLNYQTSHAPSADNPEAGITFTSANEVVTAKSETNLRSVPSTSSADTVVGVLHFGEAAQRTGVGSNGWSRLSVNGQTVYAVTSYLTVVP